jgi:hypothetical protein
MKTLKKGLIFTLGAVISLVALRQATSQAQTRSTEETMDRSAATTYEHLATAIIAIEATENELVKSILLGYNAAGHGRLRAAVNDQTGRRAHLEAAATLIADIANEGDKRIQAVRQRLSKAGHTHNTDADTKEDYLWVNSKEKKALLDLAKRVGQMGENSSAEDIKAVDSELAGLFEKAIAAE